MLSKKGFTLLEVLIVIIIMGVLAGLAIPRFSNTIEQSRAMEALSTLGELRQSLQRCYFVKGSYNSCLDETADPENNDNLCPGCDVENPNDPARRLFNYTAEDNTDTTFRIRATRRLAGSGTPTPGNDDDWIEIEEDGAKAGNGKFDNLDD